MRTLPNEGSDATQTEEQFRTVLLPNYINLSDEEISEMADFLQTWSVYYLHSVMDTLIVNSEPNRLDPEERECLVAFMHTLGLLYRKDDTDLED